jgi:hypothetical protein
MKADPDRSLKSLNMKWLVMLVVLDMIVVLLFVAPEVVKDATWNQLVVMRSLATTVLPVAVLLLTGLLSHNVKAILVYWRIKNPMPGCEAFTRHGPADVRIDMAALKKNVGELPTDPAEQNKKWFKLYKIVGDDKPVVEAHKMYLMYRDMAAMSLPLIALVPIGLYFVGATTSGLWITAAFFAVQFVACCLGARNSGTRFVCNVLAVHSTKKVSAAKEPATKAPATKAPAVK